MGGTASAANQDCEHLRADIRDRLLAHVNETQANYQCLRVSDAKRAVRGMHLPQREALMERHRKALSRHVPKLLERFALGSDIVPESIEPHLVPVKAEHETGLLFRIASTLWSVPVSSGYGRRLRFLVEDKSNRKIIGLFALGDPVAGMGVRDKWIGWSVGQRRNRLSSVLDAYVCGAVPPYSQILGGKLVVSLMSAKEVIEEFDRRYRFKPNHAGQYRYPRLALITVTSALGRSSLYNRVKLPGIVNLERLDATTKGWGHFQIPEDIFRDMRQLLSKLGHHYADAHQFGDGPNWRWRIIREALVTIGLSPNILRHGISREVYAMPLATNWRQFLQGETDDCELNRPEADSIARAAKKRWMLPRSVRFPEWAKWSKNDRAHLFEALT